jgi:hypothetical protein
MSAATDYTEALALAWLLSAEGAPGVVRPTAWYIALFTTATTDGGGGTELSTSSTGYARQSVSFSVGNNNGATKASNTASITFGPATANWGTITHMAIYTANTGGTMLFHGPLVNSRTITAGDVFQISVGNLTIELQ